MAGFFFNLGRNIGATFRKGQWMVQSATGSEADAVRAEFCVGRDMAAALVQQTAVDPDPDVVHFLHEIGARLVGRVRNKQRRWSFQAVRAGERNAFALPGGFVFVTRALLELCQWDRDETAFVLAHEMAHVLRGHAMERVMNGWALSAAGRALPLRGIAGSLLWQQASQLIGLAYSRDQELDADALGVQLAHSAEYDPYGATRLLCRLQANAVPDSPIDRYFASHPRFVDRIANVNRYLDAWRSGRPPSGL